MIELDGATLEGGGQLFRTAMALSAVTKKSCRVFNIRKNRPKPGLSTQHLLGIQALSQLCQGKLEGDFLGSQDLKFYPEEIIPKDLHIKIGTAGSITLTLQTLVLPALFAHSTSSGQAPSPVKIVFDGGATDTFFSPTIDYFQYVFLKTLEKMGMKVEINIFKRGYYPEGGAKIEIKIIPAKLKSFDLTERGKLNKILAISGASVSLKKNKVAERQIMGAKEVLGKLKLPTEEKIEYHDTLCPGSQICLIAEFENTIIGTDNLGKLGKKAEDVGREAAFALLKEQKPETCLDKYLADQILPYMALASGKSEVTVSEITNHCKTNMWVIEKFINGKFETKGNLISWSPLF